LPHQNNLFISVNKDTLKQLDYQTSTNKQLKQWISLLNTRYKNV